MAIPLGQSHVSVQQRSAFHLLWLMAAEIHAVASALVSGPFWLCCPELMYSLGAGLRWRILELPRGTCALHAQLYGLQPAGVSQNATEPSASMLRMLSLSAAALLTHDHGTGPAQGRVCAGDRQPQAQPGQQRLQALPAGAALPGVPCLPSCNLLWHVMLCAAHRIVCSAPCCVQCACFTV